MLVGIDYGTTRTVVAAVDRGNYPVVSFETESGDTQDWYPSQIAAKGQDREYGLDAAAHQGEPEWVLARSFKRELFTLGADSVVNICEPGITALDLLSEFFQSLRRDLVERSNLRLKPGEEIEVMISVPANSNSNQRFLTLEAIHKAGFNIRGMINEPSAAGVEYAHHYLSAGSIPRREFVVVYDLGGGTFDASVISMAERRHEVISAEGISRLGGDDFDQILLELALFNAGIGEISEEERLLLVEECREKKEGLHPNTRKLAIDLGRAIEGAGEVIVSTAEFYERCLPLVERTIWSMEKAVADPEGIPDWSNVGAVYLVGGSSELPVVARLLRERFGRYVKKSPYPHAATAIGLAIVGDSAAGYLLRERFTRHFGVWREAGDGRDIVLDVLFEKGTMLPEKGQHKLTRTRAYTPAHNIGHFRYLECSLISDRGQPTGDITPWDECYFPFDPKSHKEAHLERAPIIRTSLFSSPVEEHYTCDENGIIEVKIIDHSRNFQRKYRLRK